MELDAFEVMRINLFDVPSILVAENDLFDACTLGSQDFFLDSTHWHHFTNQTGFSSHGYFCLYFSLRKDRGHGSQHGDACRRSILWNCSSRYVNVEIVLFKNAVIDAKLLRFRLQVGQGRHGRLLHHVAQLTRKRQLALTPTQTGFNK